MSLWPKEHGAYGQIAFPLIAAFAVAGVSTGGLLMAAATIAAFFAHEPALVLLGHRGPRARRDLRHQARRLLAGCAIAGVGAGIAALLAVPPSARWWFAVPGVPAMVLAVAAVRGTEKTWYGETAAALAFSMAAVPAAIAGGLSPTAALALSIPFALLFVTSTLAVRVVILRVRGGGDPRAMAMTRRAALMVAAGAMIALAILAAVRLLPASVMAGAAPGLLIAAVVAVRPPAPSRLRTLGWTLVAISVLTTVIVIVAGRATSAFSLMSSTLTSYPRACAPSRT